MLDEISKFVLNYNFDDSNNSKCMVINMKCDII